MRLANYKQKQVMEIFLDELRPVLKKMHRYCMREQIELNITEMVANLVLADNDDNILEVESQGTSGPVDMDVNIDAAALSVAAEFQKQLSKIVKDMRGE